MNGRDTDLRIETPIVVNKYLLLNILLILPEMHPVIVH